MMDIYQCEGYKTLLAAVEKDEADNKIHDYRGKLAWVVERANHYGEKTGIDPVDILNAWEDGRGYWYMNYYQECNQPEIKEDVLVRVFDTVESLWTAIGDKKFRCPKCGDISTNPYECNDSLVCD